MRKIIFKFVYTLTSSGHVAMSANLLKNLSSKNKTNALNKDLNGLIIQDQIF